MGAPQPADAGDRTDGHETEPGTHEVVDTVHRMHAVTIESEPALPHVEEVRSEGGRVSVIIGDTELPVSRRHTRELRSVLTRREL